MVLINIKNIPFTNNEQLVDIFNFNPKKLCIKKVTGNINDDKEYIYYVKYDNNPFYLVIDNFKSYFKHCKEKDRNELEFIIEDQKQAKIYNRVWNKIKKLINDIDGVNFGFSDYFRDHGIIRFDTDDNLPLDDIVNDYSMTVFIKSIYRTYYDRFYTQIYLINCIYKKC